MDLNRKLSQTKPTICFVAFNAYKLFNPASSAQIGGTEAQMVAIAFSLAERDYNVSFIVGNFGQKAVETYSDITVYRSISLKKSPLHYALAPWTLWYRLYRSHAQLFISSPAGPEVGLIAFFCLLTGKKLIFRTASAVDGTLEKVRALGFLPGFFYKVGIRLANAVVCQTQACQDDVKKWHSRSSILIRNLVSAQTPHEIKERNTILWIGSARTVKQPHLFLELARNVTTQQFVMVMAQSGNKNLWEKIRRVSEGIKNVTFAGEIPSSSLLSFFLNAKVLVGTSAYEGFPNAYLEAASFGIPIISLRVNPDNFLQLHNIGYCAEGNSEAMVQLLQKLLQDPSDYQKKSQNALAYVQRFHDPNSITNDWERLIRTLFNPEQKQLTH